MKRACLAIGVNKVVGAAALAPLQAAASGAEDIAAWARTQGFDVYPLTDRAGPLGIREIKQQVRAIVDSHAYGQLLIYFAGHGLLKSWDTELWLLSDAAVDPNEAINLAGSISLARNSGIPHIVVISDACRSLSADPRLTQVTGSVLFPIQPVTPQRPEVDTFYATLPADPSYELPPAEAIAAYRAIFTDCLLKGLAGSAFEVREAVEDSGQSIVVVSSRSLKPWLEREVPILLAQVAITLNQVPELRVESQRPKYLAKLDHLPPGPVPMPAPAAPPPSPAPSPSRGTGRPGLNLNRNNPPFPEPVAVQPPGGTPDFFTLEMARMIAAPARASFETHTGFTVNGSRPVEALFQGVEGRTNIFEENGAFQIRVYSDDKPGSLILSFAENIGTCLAVLPGYIGSVTVDSGRVTNVAYTPSQNTALWGEYQVQRAEVEKRRAFVAVAARRGILRIERNEAASFANFLRSLKAIDPTLGIYAAYSYTQAGMLDQVVSVYDWMKMDSRVPVPFDVALLAGRLTEDELAQSRIAPMTPMLTQGWSLLHEGLGTPPWLLEAARYTLPALWTTLSPEGVQFVARKVREATT